MCTSSLAQCAAASFEEGCNPLREPGFAGAAVAVAQHHVGACNALAAFAHGAAHRVHRMAVDVIDHPVLRVRGVEQGFQRCLIGLQVVRDAVLHRGNAQSCVVDRRAVVQRAPDQRLAQACLAAGLKVVRPRRVEQVQVDVAGSAVRINVAARKVCRQQGCAVSPCAGIELVHQHVLGAAQARHAQDRAKVSRKLVPRVR